MGRRLWGRRPSAIASRQGRSPATGPGSARAAPPSHNQAECARAGCEKGQRGRLRHVRQMRAAAARRALYGGAQSPGPAGRVLEADRSAGATRWITDGVTAGADRTGHRVARARGPGGVHAGAAARYGRARSQRPAPRCEEHSTRSRSGCPRPGAPSTPR